ncbi:MAG: cell division protein FtsL [Betaproteobacteria bacterium]
MTRLNLMLVLAVLVSALYLVHTQYESRRLFVEVDQALAHARSLESEHDRLDLEKRAQATPLRVEKLARDSLHMQSVNPALTQYVSYQDDAAGVAAPAGSASGERR